MFLSMYFPLVSALVGEHIPQDILNEVLEGCIPVACSHLGRRTEVSGACNGVITQMLADLQLVQGLEADAEDTYRNVQRLLRPSKNAARIASSRNAGWQALYRYRFDISMSCFVRTSNDPDITDEKFVEALFGTLCVAFELGHHHEVVHILNSIRATVMERLSDKPESKEWKELIDVLKYDIEFQRELRAHPKLSDHAYWTTDIFNGPISQSLQDRFWSSSTPAVSRSELLATRVTFLNNLRRLRDGDIAVTQSLLDHITYAGEQGQVDYQRAVRVEIALASLISNEVHLADTVLAPLSIEQKELAGRRQVESLYCVSKTRQLQGRADDSMRLYCSYAAAAMERLRISTWAMLPGNRRDTAWSDDVAARLPPKYRRAYRYLLENLDQKDLSITDVAAGIGVTERALQMAFKNYLGVTPTEIIRQRRMEKIRAELKSESVNDEYGVFDVAKRWGVKSRSTLSTGYRRHFNETPSDTRKR
jgi:AraC-like DNA-binding protein